MIDKKWRIKRCDPLEKGKEFPESKDQYDDEKQAEEAAQKLLQKIEREQPTSESGGQNGVQDRVYIISPEGLKKQVSPRPETWKNILKYSRSFDELEKAISGSEKEARTTSIGIVLEMLEFVVRNIAVSGNDMEKIRVAIKAERYSELMDLAEKIYKDQYLRVKKFSQRQPSLLEKLVSEGCPKKKYKGCSCGADGRISDLYIIGGAKEGVPEFYCYECETGFGRK